ncbi:hydantoinase/oxoprolinase N-terminal domain-containing protein [Peribacillus sp. SCS-155]|uniref:hydantoinase/oxoprolinase N-terminal domain-containing protein n=1 Tax=Peribacillus sedimenti TaxID=3115297 RepID=UPI003906A4AF
MKLGIDVGGTNTDAVIVRNNGKLLSWSKHLTTADITSGIGAAAKEVLQDANISPEQIEGVFVGTTHVLNALYQPVNLSKTALIRITNRPSLIKPAVDWPEDLKKYLSSIYHFQSSYDYTGRKNGPLIMDSHDFNNLLYGIKEGNIESICIVGAYSPLYDAEEQEVKKQIEAYFPAIPITMSHHIGSTGFIERENAALLNAILSKVMRQAMIDLSSVFERLSLNCPCWITQNDGSLMEIQEAIDYPVLTIGSGITNSFRGASILSDIARCIVVDVGGSTVDIGKVVDGQPEVSVSSTSFLDIAVNMRVPKLSSLPFGGGSLISVEQELVHIKETIANDIERYGISWGGSTWTLTDSFLKVYPESFSDDKINLKGLENLSEADCRKVIKKVMMEIKTKIARFQPNNEMLPIVLVGGGSPLILNRLFGKYQKIIHPAGYLICNAVGACFAPLSAQVDKVFWLKDKTKQQIIDEQTEQLIQQLIQKGANRESIRLASIEEYPFDYMKGEVLRIRLKVLGDLEISPAAACRNK